MKKHIFIFIICFSSVIAACSQNKVEITGLTNTVQAETFNYQKSESVTKNITLETFNITVPDGSQIGGFCIYDNTIFYAIDFSPKFDNPTGKSTSIDFEKKYNTQIRSHELNTNKDKLLYQYDEKKCIQVTDLQCNGKELVWEDYLNVNSWNIKKMALSNSAIENIFSSETQKGEMSTVTLTITSDSLFWYNHGGDKDKPIELCRYDFETKKMSIEKSNLSLSSPFEHVNIVNGICTSYETNNSDTSIIHIYDLTNGKEIALNVTGSVSNPVCNGEICVWQEGYDSPNRAVLYIYDLSKRTMEKIVNSYIFSYGLLNNLVLLNQEDGLYCYDINSKEYKQLTPTEQFSYGYTFQGQQNNIYVEKIGDELQALNIVNDE